MSAITLLVYLFIMKAIEAASPGGCLTQMDIGSEDRMALQNSQIPEGSNN